MSRDSLSYQELVDIDVKLLWAIQDWVYRRRWLDTRLSKIVSRYPMYDVGIVVWLMAVIGVYEIGKRHFWVVTINLVVSFVLRKLIGAKRPVEYDDRLQPTTDIHPDSYGFPSLESHMGVVVVGHIFLRTWSWIFLPFGIAIVFLVGFSRVYSRSRFPHQIVASWLSGLVGLIGGIHYCEVLNGGFHALNEFSHGVCLAFAIAVFLVNIGMNIESNDSRIASIPKSEYMRVLLSIMGASGEQGEGQERTGAFQNADDIFLDSNDGPNSSRLRETARGAAVRRAQQNASMSGDRLGPNGRSSSQPKRDSFHFLQRTLMARATAKNGSGSTSVRGDRSTPRNAYEEINA